MNLVMPLTFITLQIVESINYPNIDRQGELIGAFDKDSYYPVLF